MLAHLKSLGKPVLSLHALDQSIVHVKRSGALFAALLLLADIFLTLYRSHIEKYSESIHKFKINQISSRISSQSIVQASSANFTRRSLDLQWYFCSRQPSSWHLHRVKWGPQATYNLGILLLYDLDFQHFKCGASEHWPLYMSRIWRQIQPDLRYFEIMVCFYIKVQR